VRETKTSPPNAHPRRTRPARTSPRRPPGQQRRTDDPAELSAARQDPTDGETARDLIRQVRRSAEQHNYSGLLPSEPIVYSRGSDNTRRSASTGFPDPAPESSARTLP